MSRAMTDGDYQAARDALRATYGDGAAERSGLFDQALARLFYRSGWTQEHLAAVEGKTQTWVTRRIRFGRFLINMPVGIIPKSLTEWRFRGYWDRTDTSETNERIRFTAVQRLMTDELSLSKDHTPKRSVAEVVLDKFADGRWHPLPVIVKGTNADEADVLAVLTQMLKRGTYHTSCEKRKGGTSWSYRIVRGHGRTVDVDVLLQEVGPIVRALDVEGRKHVAQCSPGTIAKLAHDLKAILERLTHESLQLARKQARTKETTNVSTNQVTYPSADTGPRTAVS